MDIYVCRMCGHIYDSAKGEAKSFSRILCDSGKGQCEIAAEQKTPYVKPGVDFKDLPADFRCPVCGYPKSFFRKQVPEPLAALRTLS